MISNQLRVLIQRCKLRAKTPWKVLMPKGLRWALEEEMKSKVGYRKTDQGHYFDDLLVIVDNSLKEPVILIKPEPRSEPLELAVKGNPYAVC